MAVFEDRVFENSTDEWATPKSLVRPLADAVDGFDLDPASGAEDKPHAENVYTKTENGLTQPWFGNVFVNPPFSNKVEWVEKAIAETEANRADLVLMVLPSDTSTEWFHNLVTQATVICFVGPGRQDFDRRSDYPRGGNPSFGIQLVVYGDRVPKRLLGVLGTRGTVFYTRSLHRETYQTQLRGGDP